MVLCAMEVSDLVLEDGAVSLYVEGHYFIFVAVSFLFVTLPCAFVSEQVLESKMLVGVISMYLDMLHHCCQQKSLVINFHYFFHHYT